MESRPAYPYLESINTRDRSKRKRVSGEIRENFQRKRVKISITYECDFEIVKICRKYAKNMIAFRKDAVKLLTLLKVAQSRKNCSKS